MFSLESWGGKARAISAIIMVVGLIGGAFAKANDLFLTAAEAEAWFATKEEMEELHRDLPLEVDLRLKRSALDDLDTTILYGRQNSIDTGLEELKRSQLAEKIGRLESELEN